MKTIREASIDLTVEIVAMCNAVSDKNVRVFTNQIIRSCSSIGANASEAKYAQSPADFINKMEIALKECYETDYWLELLFKTGTVGYEEYTRLSANCNRIRRQIISSIKKVKDKGEE